MAEAKRWAAEDPLPPMVLLPGWGCRLFGADEDGGGEGGNDGGGGLRIEAGAAEDGVSGALLDGVEAEVEAGEGRGGEALLGVGGVEEDDDVLVGASGGDGQSRAGSGGAELHDDEARRLGDAGVEEVEVALDLREGFKAEEV